MNRVMDWGGPTAPLRFDGASPGADTLASGFVQDCLRDLADGHVGFYGWLCAVNAQCQTTDRLNLFDLPLRDWRDEYDGRVPPEEAADVALDEFVSVHGAK